MEDRDSQSQDKKVTDVVFVIHGIRDEGFWTKKIARKIKILGNKNNNELGNNNNNKRKWRTETSTYGYFALSPFLFPYHRQVKTAWLMEQYTKNLSLYPYADFHYVGHSNGTYLVARALEEYHPWCKFEHIVFAGSVVTSNYKWEERVKERQVKKILNFVASGDWAVGFFPNLFEILPFGFNKDLGGAGHNGFHIKDLVPGNPGNFLDCEIEDTQNESEKIYTKDKSETIHQLKYAIGAHGAALKEKHWDAIAKFIVDGDINVEDWDKLRRTYIASIKLPLFLLFIYSFYGNCSRAFE